MNTLGSENITWSSILENRDYGKLEKSDHHFFSASTNTQYTNGKISSRDLIIDILDVKGTPIAKKLLSDTSGYTTICMITDADHAYLMFQKELTKKDRDLYIAKIDSNANILWSTRIGKRIGTFGAGLLNINKEGRIIAMSNHYEPVFIDVLDPGTGNILESHRLDFPYDMDIESFIINPAGNVVAIATQIYYVGWTGVTSILLFELDKGFNVIRQQFFNSILEDWAQDIVLCPDGNYMFLVRSEFDSQEYKEDFEIHILGLMDQNFKLLHQQAIEIEDDATYSTIRLHKERTYLYHRNTNGFNLLILNPALKLTNTYSNHKTYGYPNFLAIGHDDQVWIGGYIGNMWLAELALGKQK
jgi:hypothetical protein